ncbi:lysoplasmalogenase [Vibrio sp. V39_P1S14PM300]|uniref:lysoplasmalogenase n=1 Tax=Vibrio sp. V39_P1S14PM300 TaxID=1938690 RepID=UPI001372D5F8|nr:lysoplasmalogenase [Vibrio sp. V39_P1S14PM300]NAX21897.1 lysoplasmalogenase [Vibrio sp. V39_P1S14PM300]
MWLAIGLTALIHILSIDRGPKWIFYLSKPTPIVLMMAVIFHSDIASLGYAQWILAGLALSAIGDVFLMHPKDKFVPGLLSFLLAHIAYAIGFSEFANPQITHWMPILLLCSGVIVFLFLLPNLGNMAIPVAFYILVIMVMTWCAMEYWHDIGSQSASLAMMGAFIFMLSDLVLAIDRFRSTSKFSRHVIMVTYYTAQALITLSAVALSTRVLTF